MKNTFSNPREILYFNSANLSLCPNPVIEAIEKYRRQFEENPTQGLKEAWGRLWEVQNDLARFLGAAPQDLLLRTNVTEVLNTFILGLPLQPQDEILLGELEYGAIANICKFRAKRDSLNIRILKIPQSQMALAKLTEEKLIENIVSQFSKKSRVLVLSHVIASLGLKIPIEKISQITRKQNIALIVDGAYAPGAIEVNFKNFNDVDFYGCSLYKWLLGPKGTAFGWVSPIHQDSLIPLQAGWTTFDSAGDFASFGGGSRFQERFQLLGCRDFAPFYALKDLFQLWDSMGSETLREHIAHINRIFQREIKIKLGKSPLLAQDPSLHGPMTVFRVHERLQSLGERLAGVVLSRLKIQLHFTPLNSGWYGVFSPHIYNTETEVMVAIDRFKELL